MHRSKRHAEPSAPEAFSKRTQKLAGARCRAGSKTSVTVLGWKQIAEKLHTDDEKDTGCLSTDTQPESHVSAHDLVLLALLNVVFLTLGW